MIKSFYRGWRAFLLALVCGYALCGSITTVLSAVTEQAPIDYHKAQDLNRRSQLGEKLSPDDQAYLDRAKAERAKRGIQSGRQAVVGPDPADMKRFQEIMQKQRAGQPVTEEEQAFIKQTIAKYQTGGAKSGKQGPGMSAAPAPRDSTGLVPLDQMTAQEKYKNQDGGLYGGGKNQPPAQHLQAALAEAKKIVPLDPGGKPSAKGKIVLLSIGMSNTTQEYSRFKELADADSAKSPLVVIVDGAQGGQDAEKWNSDDAKTWQVVEERMKAAGVTAAQVQAVWMKHARISPARFGEFPQHTDELQKHIAASLQLAKKRFPNLRMVYLSSRIYAGYATTGLNPEPYSYEGAFAVRNLIQQQIQGDPQLNSDPTKGEVKVPLLLWGPYLWADGMTPRKSDSLIWKREDLSERDGTHPSPTFGREKVAQLLLKFLKTDVTARPWFTGSVGN
jgi:hypothetical protein